MIAERDINRLTGSATCALAGVSLLVSTAFATTAQAAPIPPTVTDGTEAAAIITESSMVAAVNQRVLVPNVNGTFAFTQDTVTPNDQIARALGIAGKVLCSAGESMACGTEEVVADATDWMLTVGGDGVGAGFSATLGELSASGSQTTIMGCTCLGNPADGRATANAACTGVPIRDLIQVAGLVDGANTITFTCADGYTVSLPLNYVLQRASMIVYQINGAPLSDSIGGTNQLWLGSTAARYFASDVVSIMVTCEVNPPAAPGTIEAGDAYANRPNVGILEGISA